MTLDLAALKRVAEAATQGEWKHYRAKLRPQFSQRINEVVLDGQKPIVTWMGFDGNDRPEKQNAANAAHIAAFDPPTCLALLDALAEAQAERDRLAKQVEAMKASMGECMWTEIPDEAGWWATSCGKQWWTEDFPDTPTDAGLYYCFNCGKRVGVAALAAQEDTKGGDVE